MASQTTWRAPLPGSSLTEDTECQQTLAATSSDSYVCASWCTLSIVAFRSSSSVLEGQKSRPDVSDAVMPRVLFLLQGETKADDSSNKEAAEEKQEDDNDYHRSDEQVSGCGVCPNTATGRTCTGRLRRGCALAQQRGRREGNGARTLVRPACACLHFFNCRSNVCSLQNILNIQKLRFTLRTLGAPSVPRSSLSNSVPSDFGVHANVT